MSARRTTMRDVARASGVSPATVSFVMNDAPDQTISEATRERVRRAAAELGYRAHPIARALREGTSRVVVLDVGGLPRDRVLESFADGMESELSAAGYALLVSYSRRSRRAQIEAVNPRAVIDLPSLYARPGAIADGGWVDGMASHYLTQIEFLHGLGHRELAVAVPARPDRFMRLMTSYVVRATEALDMPAPRMLPVAGEAATLAAVRDLLGGSTAVAALTDGLALAVLAALHDVGASVPGDLAVIGWGDSAEAARWRPALTSVRIDAAAYGRRLARQALDLPADDTKPAATRVIRRATT
ncbi:LacI family DNA-binding transcriptional regulator [Actinoplanes sp. CA-142083]|uniref:LacI family DNA-binding transcriptional regulator n=1 Tax=Actinoplanes sp. CA-142083 TaxID=3239903 RepID=UPI003D923445